MKKSSPLAAAAIAAFLVSSLAACSGDGSGDGGSADGGECTPSHEVSTIESGTITAATFVYPPFTDLEDGKLTGFEGDLITMVADSLCLSVTPMEVGIPAIVPAITAGRADVGFGDFYRTAERNEIVRLGTPIVSDSMAFVVRDGVDVQTVDDLKGQRVGAAIGYLWDADLDVLLGDDLTAYSDLQSAYADFEAGRIDVLVDTVPVAAERLSNMDVEAEIVIPPSDDRIGATLAPGQTNFMTSLDNPELGEAIDELIIQFRKDGVIAELLDKWGMPADIGEPGEPILL